MGKKLKRFYVKVLCLGKRPGLEDLVSVYEIDNGVVALGKSHSLQGFSEAQKQCVFPCNFSPYWQSAYPGQMLGREWRMAHSSSPQGLSP